MIELSEDEQHPATTPVDQLVRDCDFRRQRRGGPGGQHRNKVETAVIVLHTPSGVMAEANERRSQEQNRREALFRLRVNLALKVRRVIKEDYASSAAWNSRCRGGRVHLSAKHDDFPTLLSEALDVLLMHDFDIKAASNTLGVSVSQLTKLLKNEPRAMQQVNQRRGELGLRPLQ